MKYFDNLVLILKETSNQYMKVIPTMKQESLPTKEMLQNIISMRSRALSLFEQNKRYSTFLKYVLAKDLFNEEKPAPALKELSKASGIKYPQLRKLIEEAYLDLINYETQPPFSLSKVRYEFHIRGWRKKSVYSIAEQLPIIPRIGESVGTPFFYGFTGDIPILCRQNTP
jgi:hypothetical protein